MATILLANVDLFMRGKLDALLPSHQLITATTARPDLVICDIARVDPQEIADAHSDVPIIGYAQHTDTAGLRAAHAAGFDQVVVKSALVERAGQLINQLLQTPTEGNAWPTRAVATIRPEPDEEL